jgi:RNA recognition motif-containing protein
VTRVDIPTGRQGRSRGYGLVEFNSEAEAQAAVTRMDGA